MPKILLKLRVIYFTGSGVSKQKFAVRIAEVAQL